MKQPKEETPQRKKTLSSKKASSKPISAKSDKISIAADEPQPTTAEAPTTIMSRDRETPQQVIKEV